MKFRSEKVNNATETIFFFSMEFLVIFIAYSTAFECSVVASSREVII